jgi:hypothetical protein
MTINRGNNIAGGILLKKSHAGLIRLYNRFCFEMKRAKGILIMVTKKSAIKDLKNVLRMGSQASFFENSLANALRISKVLGKNISWFPKRLTNNSLINSQRIIIPAKDTIKGSDIFIILFIKHIK